MGNNNVVITDLKIPIVPSSNIQPNTTKSPVIPVVPSTVKPSTVVPSTIKPPTVVPSSIKPPTVVPSTIKPPTVTPSPLKPTVVPNFTSSKKPANSKTK